MISIDEAFIEAAAPNSEAAKNGRGLVLKGKYARLCQSDDGSLIFGHCQGSGKQPYLCSADFAVPQAPIYRCTCPSRQFPCKHSLGLLFAYIQGKPFLSAEVPEELAVKREKIQQRTEKKKAEADKPKTVNKAALAKKIQAQIAGIDLLENLTLALVRLGIGNMNAKSAREIEDQAKQLGNAFLPGAQAALHNYTRLFSTETGEERSTKERESVYSEALDQLGRLYALVKEGRAYLAKRLEDPELKPETDSSIAAWLGHAWQLRELKDAGLVQKNIELIQVAFNTHDDIARQEYVDTGIWMNLENGRIQVTQTFRPYKAAKFIRSDDSFFQVAQVEDLCIYPGGINPRIRWDAMTPRLIHSKDLERVRSFGQADFAAAVKDVKSHLKGPLSDKQPILALNFRRLGQIAGQPVLEDAKGERLTMTETGMTEEPSSCHLFGLLPADVFTDQTLVARFRHDLDARKLQIKPLSIVTKTDIIRLTL